MSIVDQHCYILQQIKGFLDARPNKKWPEPAPKSGSYCTILLTQKIILNI